MLNNEEIVVGLKQALDFCEIVMVEFTKANGDTRQLTAVLDPKTIGVDFNYQGGNSPAEYDVSGDTQVVFDVDVKEFRQFKYSNVISWSLTH